MSEIVKPKKKSVPKVVKDLSWNKWVGEDTARTKCMCCGVNEIRMNSFHCGHVIAESNGGRSSVDNLRPICSACNLSMGTENMEDFKKRCEFKTLSVNIEKKTEFDDESETPVEWNSGILLTRTPKFIKAPRGKPVVINGKEIYLIGNTRGNGEFEQDVTLKYSLYSPGIYKRK